MAEMIIKMSAITAVMVVLTVLLWLWYGNKKLNAGKKIIIGMIFGLAAIASTHFGVDYDNMVLNVRDIAPLSAGLFFDPVSGIIAGIVGGVERYIAGTYFGVGSYTRIACSVSTCLAGFLAAIFNVKLFKGRKPSAFYTFFIGAVMEVFHMYVVFITHRADMKMAFYVVDTCSIPMIIFTGLGMAASSFAIYFLSGQFKGGVGRLKRERQSISAKFQAWLFICTVAMFILTFAFAFKMQTQSAIQDAQNTMTINSDDAKEYIQIVLNDDSTDKTADLSEFDAFIANRHIGENGSIYILDRNFVIISGDNAGGTISGIGPLENKPEPLSYFNAEILGEECYCRYEKVGDSYSILTTLPLEEIYRARKTSAYETAFADILLFTLIFILIYVLVQLIIVNNLDRINSSLSKITHGDLNEVVKVNASTEFASLSKDINLTVDALKGYIEQAEKRIEEELEFARAIQAAALPRVFRFPNRDEFELFASMDPAKEVGGDFYDFFFVDKNKIALVIADVSGKGIPAALFMMRSKTAIKSLAETGRSPSEIFERANNALAEGNDACMFVTAWIGILDLETGKMQCANAGHEYPVLKRANGDFELFKDKHDIMLATVGDMPFGDYQMQLNPGDKLFVYTDGVPEAINKAEEQYGTDKMTKTLNILKDKNVNDILYGIREDIRAFAGDAEQFDDITMLGIEFKHTTEVKGDTL